VKRQKAKLKKGASASHSCFTHFYWSCFLLLPFTFCLASGCADTTSQSQGSQMRQRQDDALKDPMGYDAKDVPTVTGGGTADFDKKAFNRDVDHVLNP
jgi:hypothetical protein